MFTKEYFNSKIDEIFTDFDKKLATESIDYVYSQIELIDDDVLHRMHENNILQ